jgi:hypothetical protein
MILTQHCILFAWQFFEDTKEVARSRKLQWTKRQTIIYKTVHRKIKIEQHEPHKTQGWGELR